MSWGACHSSLWQQQSLKGGVSKQAKENEPWLAWWGFSWEQQHYWMVAAWPDLVEFRWCLQCHLIPGKVLTNTPLLQLSAFTRMEWAVKHSLSRTHIKLMYIVRAPRPYTGTLDANKDALLVTSIHCYPLMSWGNEAIFIFLDLMGFGDWAIRFNVAPWYRSVPSSILRWRLVYQQTPTCFRDAWLSHGANIVHEKEKKKEFVFEVWEEWVGGELNWTSCRSPLHDYYCAIRIMH